MYLKIKKILTAVLFIACVLAWTTPVVKINAQGTGHFTGKIKMLNDNEAIKNTYKLVGNNTGFIPGGTQLAELSGVKVKLLSSTNDELLSTISDTHGGFSFTGLDDGEYYVEIEKIYGGPNGVPFEIIPGLVHDTFDFNQQKQARSGKITIAGGNATIEETDVKGNTTNNALSMVYYPVVKKPYALSIVIPPDLQNLVEFSVVNASNQPLSLDYFTVLPGATKTITGDTQIFTDGLFAFPVPGQDPNRRFTLLMGGIHDAKVGNYHFSLPKPTLTQQGEADELEFKGWTIAGESFTNYSRYFNMAEDGLYYSRVLETNEILDITFAGDLVLQPFYTLSVNKTVFKTNGEKATLETIVFPESDKQINHYYDVIEADSPNQITRIALGSSPKIGKFPTPTSKPGYEFIGWIDDLSKNVVDADVEADKKVSKEKVYYAQFRPIGFVVPKVNPLIAGENLVTGTASADSKVQIFDPELNQMVEVTTDAAGEFVYDPQRKLKTGENFLVVALQKDMSNSLSISATVVDKTVFSANPYIIKLELNKLDGKGVAGAEVKLVINKNQTEQVMTVDDEGNFSFDLSAAKLTSGDVVSVIQTESGKARSSSIEATLLSYADFPSSDCSCENNIGASNGPISSFHKDIKMYSGRGRDNVPQTGEASGPLAMRLAMVLIAIINVAMIYKRYRKPDKI